MTKWIEVKSVTNIKSVGVPNRIITDLGSTFTSNEFWDYCADSMIDAYSTHQLHTRGATGRWKGRMACYSKDSRHGFTIPSKTMVASG